MKKIGEGSFMKKNGLAVTAMALMLICTVCILTAIRVEHVKKLNVRWGGDAFLETDAFTNITSANNLFPDYPTVTNNADNPGDVTFRIINEGGAWVGEAKTAKPGESVKMDKIPASSGDYTILGKATERGHYFIVVD